MSYDQNYSNAARQYDAMDGTEHPKRRHSRDPDEEREPRQERAETPQAVKDMLNEMERIARTAWFKLIVFAVLLLAGTVHAETQKPNSVTRPPSTASKQGNDSAQDVPNRTLDKLLDAIQAVESRGHTETPLLGDGGKARGPLQIHAAYWRDAVDFDRRLKGVYSDVDSAAYSRRVVVAYMQRHCPKALESLDYETISRTHNGGPKGPLKQTTISYWIKVKKSLEALHVSSGYTDRTLELNCSPYVFRHEQRE